MSHHHRVERDRRVVPLYVYGVLGMKGIHVRPITCNEFVAAEVVTCTRSFLCFNDWFLWAMDE